MVCIVKTVSFNGISAQLTEVQVSISTGMPSFVIVGLPDKAISESKERVRAVLTTIGVDFPAERITVNLTPADMLKEGTHYDLPIAIGLLAAMKVIPCDVLNHFIFMGALGLDGRLERVNGVLPAAVRAKAEDLGFVCPAANGGEAVWSQCELLLAVGHILELLNYLKGNVGLPLTQPAKMPLIEENTLDMADVKGQESAKRALLIAAAGGHNLLMIGPPGSGKTMLAERLPSILPKMSVREALETAMIHSVAGTFNEQLSLSRPFRAPHHSASAPALIGGGRKGVPGEISLAHNGVLFLDELPEFSRTVLDSLRQPLECKKAVIARVMAHTVYPADFQLVAAMNPCRCGYLGVKERQCTNAPQCAAHYLSRLSGPLLDRFDMQIDVPAVNPYDLTSEKVGMNSQEMAKLVLQAREMALERFDKFGVSDLKNNAELKGEILEKALDMDENLRHYAAEAAEKCGLSARSLVRILRLARTIADLQNEKKVSKMHIIEALSYRHKLLSKPN